MKTVPCRGCGKPIVFALTPEGKRIPLDTVAPVYTVVVADQDDNPDTCVRNRASYVSHFATCPKASEFSAARKKP